MNTTTRDKPNAYLMEQQNTGHKPVEGGCPGKGHREIVDPGANVEEIFNRHHPNSQKQSSKIEEPLHLSILSG